MTLASGFVPPRPEIDAFMRFLFVRLELCLRLPSDPPRGDALLFS